jgi:DNA-binding NarL/FixJ family response regulator
LSHERSSFHVGLVEDDRAARKGLAQLIDGTPGFDCVGDWMSVEAALADESAKSPDVLLVDVDLPGRSGSEAVPELRARFPGATVVMHTVFDDDDRLFEAICNGASGYLSKGTPPARILEAIREAADGGAPLSPSVARRMVSLFRGKAAPRGPDSSLTAREIELLTLLAEGHSYRAAAEALGVSINTVRKHVRCIYEKLHVHSKSAAVSKAIRAGWI